MEFINDNFLLESVTARELYQKHAQDQPIIDYHCHLCPTDLAENRRFSNLYDLWLANDHYKWRAMRLNGEPEELCSGDADPYDKFMAYARTVPYTLRNPIFHWTHLELKRYFGIDTLLNEATAPEIWEKANAALEHKDHSTWGILERHKVTMIGTTDDPTDDLSAHQKLAQSACPTRVLPSFRPDSAYALGDLQTWNKWTDRLAAASGIECANLANFKQALLQRIKHFKDLGCVASDHGLSHCPRKIASDSEATRIFENARRGQEDSNEYSIDPDHIEAFTGHLLCWLGEQYKKNAWVMQLHLGAIRNVNRSIYNSYGADAGCDSIDDTPQIKGLAVLLGELSACDQLPKTILYNLDPAKNYPFASMCGNFFETNEPAKIQFGSGWWFLDQIEGMTKQINALSNLGLLSKFIGMLTDSRSLMSYPRHEYFRRILCNILGNEIERGYLPSEMDFGALVSGVCYKNAKNYFNL